MTRIEWPTAMAAFFLPMRLASRQPAAMPWLHACRPSRSLWEEKHRWGRKELAVTATIDVGFVEVRISKVVGLAVARHAAGHEVFQYVVLEEVAGDRQLAIEIGWAEAVSLAARLGGKQWPRPMTYQFVAALVRALGGRVRQVRIDRVVERA